MVNLHFGARRRKGKKLSLLNLDNQEIPPSLSKDSDTASLGEMRYGPDELQKQLHSSNYHGTSNSSVDQDSEGNMLKQPNSSPEQEESDRSLTMEAVDHDTGIDKPGSSVGVGHLKWRDDLSSFFEYADEKRATTGKCTGSRFIAPAELSRLQTGFKREVLLGHRLPGLQQLSSYGRTGGRECLTCMKIAIRDACRSGRSGNKSGAQGG
ncbi:hypothetical protein FQN57_003987 [Myotisia sp. PD_48]|nr:hypothetical protein FQN57_003987 [Myotisia sp. PD_48]